MSMVGRVGGKNGTESDRAFSEGMNWINFEPPFPIISTGSSNKGGDGAQATRRQSKGKGKNVNKADSEDDVECEECDFVCGALEAVERALVCSGILLSAYLVRSAVNRLYMRYRPNAKNRDDINYDLQFPAWEGPLFLMEIFGLCDVGSKLLFTGCTELIVIGALILIAPCLFILVATWKIRECVRNGDIEFDAFEPLPFREIFKKVLKKPGFGERMNALSELLDAKRFSGHWVAKTPVGHAWSFCLMYTGKLSIFFSFVVFKRFVSAIAVNVEALSVYLLSPVLLLVTYFFGMISGLHSHTHNDRVESVAESIGAACNFATLLVAVLKIALREGQLPDFLQGPFVIFPPCLP